MKQVTKDQFYAAMRGDVHPSMVGPYPYTSSFRTRMGTEVGRIVPVLPALGNYCTESLYFIRGQQ